MQSLFRIALFSLCSHQMAKSTRFIYRMYESYVHYNTRVVTNESVKTKHIVKDDRIARFCYISGVKILCANCSCLCLCSVCHCNFSIFCTVQVVQRDQMIKFEGNICLVHARQLCSFGLRSLEFD